MAEIAREAGALLMGYFHQHVKVEYKGDADLVTIADRNSEILIRQRIKTLWPSHDVLGEEQGLVDTGSDYRWYVDPLDGTTNFAHGFPVFCVSLALEHKNQRIAGVVYDPTRDELFAAEKGSATSGTRIQTFISIIRLPCGPTVCAAQAQRLWTCAAWPADASTDSGSSTSIPGTRLQGC
jgi:myo-inositol-1(or 4)-monophosphatase